MGELHAPARFALHADGVEIYVASTWDSGGTWIASMQHIAKEGRCWVIGSGCLRRTAEVPTDFAGREAVFDQGVQWLNPGDSVVVAPGGNIVAGPLHEDHGILSADIDVGRAAADHRVVDVAATTTALKSST